MSTTIVPGGAFGTWKMDSLDLSQAKNLMSGEWISAVGHESTAEVLSDLLAIEIPQNRITVSPTPGDKFVCFRLLQRPPEGAILDKQTLESIGYEFAVMDYISY